MAKCTFLQFQENYWFSTNEILATELYCKDNNMEYEELLNPLANILDMLYYTDKPNYTIFASCLFELVDCAKKLDTQIVYQIERREEIEKRVWEEIRELEKNKDLDIGYFYLLTENLKRSNMYFVIRKKDNMYEPLDKSHIAVMYFDLQRKLREKIKPYEEKVNQIRKESGSSAPTTMQ